MIKQKFDLKDFVPSEIYSGKFGNKYPLDVNADNYYLMLSYFTPVHNHNGITDSTKEYSTSVRRYISRESETFEVLGLLQAEMGKTQNGCLNFSNHEYQIIKKVMKWFEKKLELMPNMWRWYIKVNINEPTDEIYKKQIEDKVISYWLTKSKIDISMKYPKTVSYIKNTNNKKLGYYDYGTLIIEHKNNILSQVVKNFVKEITYNHILSSETEEIRSFMKGIIAGEGCIEANRKTKKFRVHISAVKPDEKLIYGNCLAKLGIESKNYKGDKLVISQKHNLLELLKQKLICLSNQKYNKFLQLFKNYSEFPEYAKWKNKKPIVHNKIPDKIVNKIVELYKQNPLQPCWKIAEQLNISAIKVQRVLKANSLGKRVIKTSELKRQEIAEYAEQNLHLTQKQISEDFNVHENVVIRAIKKYQIERGNKSRCKIPEEKIQRILQIYKDNPAAKVSDICKELDISDTVVKRVRKEYNLSHLGYRHLIGCNNKKKQPTQEMNPAIAEI